MWTVNEKWRWWYGYSSGWRWGRSFWTMGWNSEMWRCWPFWNPSQIGVVKKVTHDFCSLALLSCRSHGFESQISSRCYDVRVQGAVHFSTRCATWVLLIFCRLSREISYIYIAHGNWQMYVIERWLIKRCIIQLQTDSLPHLDFKANKTASRHDVKKKKHMEW